MPKIKLQKAENDLPVIAIVGRPNVGKSSLFNAIIGRRLSIVHEMPGVTRDRVIAPVVRGTHHFELIDTGGLGMLQGESRKVDVWDKRIADQVEVAIEGADVLIMVANVVDGIVPLDQDVAAKLRQSGKKILFAANKCDNPTLIDNAVDFMQLGFDKVFAVSCLHRTGINTLIEEAITMLPRHKVKKAAADTAAADTAAIAPLRKINIAVVGRPNVGKSSLVNALLGEERVMVSDVAGTTRDAIDVDFTIRYQSSERPATLVDTAGLRKTAKVDNLVEYFSVMRAKTAIEKADLVLFVVEASPDGVTAQDKRIASMIQTAGKGCVIVANKFDLFKSEYKVKQLQDELRYSLPGMTYSPVVFVSAKDKANLDGLLDQAAEVMEQLEVKIPTGILNRVLADAFVQNTPPVVGSAPLRMFYASMAGMMPPKVVIFVNNPKFCADNYLAFLKNVLRRSFDLTGLPIEIELRARPKKIESIRTERSPIRKPAKSKKQR